MKTRIEDHFTEFETVCLLDRLNINVARVRELWDKADNKSSFIRALQADPELRFSQACGILSRNNYYFIRSMIGDHMVAKTKSDAGSVRVFHDGFYVYLPNGEGDGDSRVCLFRKGEHDLFNSHLFNYQGMLSGSFDVDDYDCNDVPHSVLHLEGSYHVYFGSTFVVFLERD